MSVEYDIDPGFDPTALATITDSQLLQLVEQALPKSNRGRVIFSATTPDTVNNTHLRRYLWIDTSTSAPYIIRAYNPDTVSWEGLELADGSITTVKIANGAVTLAKLDAASGAALDLLRIDSGGTAFEYVTLASILAADTVPLTALNGTSSSTGDLITYNGSTWATGPLDLVNTLLDNSVAHDKLVNASAQYEFLISNASNVFASRAFSAATDIADASIQGTKLENSTVTADKLASIPGAYNEFAVQFPYYEHNGGVFSDNFSASLPVAFTNVTNGFVNLFRVNNDAWSSLTGTAMNTLDFVFDQTELDLATGGGVTITDITELIILVQFRASDTDNNAGLYYEDSTPKYRQAFMLRGGDPAGSDVKFMMQHVTVPNLLSSVFNLRLGTGVGGQLGNAYMGIKIMGYKI